MLLKKEVYAVDTFNQINALYVVIKLMYYFSIFSILLLYDRTLSKVSTTGTTF